VQVSIELPEQYMSSVMGQLARMGGRPAAAASAGIGYIRCGLPTEKVTELRRHLPGMSGGQGTLEAGFSGYEPVTGPPPHRRTPSSSKDRPAAGT
jgi:translation elongation factor EF-G